MCQLDSKFKKQAFLLLSNWSLVEKLFNEEIGKNSHMI